MAARFCYQASHGWVAIAWSNARGQVQIQSVDLCDGVDAQQLAATCAWQAVPAPLQRCIQLLRSGADLREHEQAVWHLLDLSSATAFRQRVWRAAFRFLGPGEVMSYAQLAQYMGCKPGSARAVGQALRHNPFPLLVPCHRVVAANGLGGFMGAPAQPQGRKAAILASEENQRRAPR